MPYTDPATVTAPRKKWDLTEVLYHAKSSGWSVAKGEWEKEPTIGIRWNGDEVNVGTPQSRGNPTWFILPEIFHEAILEVIGRLKEDEISIHIHHPPSYDPSAWRFEATLSEKMQKELQVLGEDVLTAVRFEIPKLEDAGIIPESAYGAYCHKNKIAGKFDENGTWLGDIYLRPDKNNADVRRQVAEALRESIRREYAKLTNKNSPGSSG